MAHTGCSQTKRHENMAMLPRAIAGVEGLAGRIRQGGDDDNLGGRVCSVVEAWTGRKVWPWGLGGVAGACTR